MDILWTKLHTEKKITKEKKQPAELIHMPLEKCYTYNNNLFKSSAFSRM